jgi:SCY1-like protein 1
MGNSASSLPYSIDKHVSTVNHGWALHEGNRKSDGGQVSVFVAKKPALSKTPVDRGSPNMMQIDPALYHFSNCKKLRHPHILQVYATLDTDNPTDQAPTGMGSTTQAKKATETGDLIIVTESCISLEAWLSTSPPPEMLAWGLESAVRALHFMHASASLSHGNVSPESFYVTRSGDVKLWNFSLVTKVADPLNRNFADWEALLTPLAYRSPERIESRWDAIGNGGVHSMDSFGVSVLVSHFFGGHVPQPLIKAVQRMQTPNIRMRPRLQPLLKCPVFDTPYQQLQLQLEEFAVQPPEQKTSFWQTVTPQCQAGLIPRDLSVYRLLPMIKHTVVTISQSDTLRTQDQYRRERKF